MNKKLLIALCAFALINSYSFAQETINAEMSLEVEGAEAEGFRGTSSSSGNKNFLEDCSYKLDENSLIYKNAGEAVGGAGNVAVGAPNITWSVTQESDDGNDEVISSNNTNKQSSKCDFTNPGTYHVSNSGSRQISDATGAGEGGIATANQTMGVVVHDVTPPDVCIAFQEAAGDSNNCKCEEELEKQLLTKMVSSAGAPFVSSVSDVADEPTSYIFVDEGDSRDKAPANKTVRVTLAGSMFDKDGKASLNSAELPTATLSGGDKTRKASVSSDESGAFSGIYVRRNVPFFVMVRSIDNGDKRKTVGSTAADGVSYTLKDSTGKEVSKEEDGSYLFRVQNYPRDKYADQPGYVFEANVRDGSGNLTTVKSDVFVVNNEASFEN